MALHRLQTIHDPEQVTTAVSRTDLAPASRLQFAMSVLKYNQGFVTFTDGKANSLLLVNSIFLATLASAGLASGLSIAAVAAAATAVLLCLGVVWARMSGTGPGERGQLVFFDHILRRRNPAAYVEDFRQASPDEMVECTVRQVYDLASVVDRKFKAYRLAQLTTVLSAALWIANLLAPALTAGPGA